MAMELFVAPFHSFLYAQGISSDGPSFVSDTDHLHSLFIIWLAWLEVN
jgi:hypothetical protein